MSLFGLPFKLQLMGLDIGDPWAVGQRIGRVYTVLLLILAVVAARRDPGSRRDQAVTWMSLLVLASLQSPFAPGYTLIALLWALTLLAVEVTTLRGGAALVLLWLGLAILVPWPDIATHAAHSVVQSMLAVAVPVWLILRAGRRRASA